MERVAFNNREIMPNNSVALDFLLKARNQNYKQMLTLEFHLNFKTLAVMKT
jgi:hypothetical protein